MIRIPAGARPVAGQRPSRLLNGLRGLRALALSACAFSTGAAAAAPPVPVTAQVPGYYRQAVGPLVVTALYDGYVDLATSELQGLSTATIERLQARAFVPAGEQGAQTAVNAYLVHTADRLVLVDTGTSKCFGPVLGQVLPNLRASGYTPEQVDTVLLTHLHPDHMCGLLDGEGRVAFPSATVWAAQEDIDYWLDAASEKTAPEALQPLFGMARTAAAPYQAADRLKGFKRGDAPLGAGIEFIASHGHTPGHTSYLFHGDRQRLLVWGDIVHYHAVQFAHPEATFDYDSDRQQALATRRTLLGRAARGNWVVAGAHLPFPGLGHVLSDGRAYGWVPVEFGPIREER